MQQYRDTDYAAVSAALHAREAKLLTQAMAERMIDASTPEESYKTLLECGYATLERCTLENVEHALSQARRELYREVSVLGAGQAHHRALSDQVRLSQRKARTQEQAHRRGRLPPCDGLRPLRRAEGASRRDERGFRGDEPRDGRRRRAKRATAAMSAWRSCCSIAPATRR